MNNDILKEIKLYQNIVIENLNEKINEKLVYTLLNIVDQDNKYLIVTTTKPIVEINFSLVDLRSRSKILFYKILKNLTMNWFLL